jgi:glutamate/tyrosine decarboxylase-like PLP-dependent enzyme
MNKTCKPEEIALKSFFLGPQSENAVWMQSIISELLVEWFEWRQSRFVEDGRAISPMDQALPEFKNNRKQMSDRLTELTKRFEKEVPKYSPRYAGHMFSEVALPAMLGHILGLLHNPNIISGESARVGVEIENEAIDALIEMIGYEVRQATGHFTSGGTVANLESVMRARARMALWLAAGCLQAELSGGKPDPFLDSVMGWQKYDETKRKIAGCDASWAEKLEAWNFEKIGFHTFLQKIEKTFGIKAGHPVMLAPAHRHYSWPKSASLFGFGDETLKAVHLDDQGRMNVAHLEQRISDAQRQMQPLMMVVSVAGTTELGVMDPVNDVAEKLATVGAVWHHCDAAYGGFFAVLKNADSELGFDRSFLDAINGLSKCTSLTIDPHKLGYVPYAAGVYLVRDRRDYDLRAISAPYIQYESRDRGIVTLEGSRPATGAAATWMMAKTMPFNSTGFGKILQKNFEAKNMLERELCAISAPVRIIQTGQTNVLCCVIASEGERLSLVNDRTNRIYEALSKPDSRFFVSKTTISWQAASALCEKFTGSWASHCDCGDVVLLRMCLMNPFFTSRETSISYAKELAKEIEAIVNKDASVG